MITYTDQINLAKEISNLSDNTSVINFKRDINAGTARFMSMMGRPYNRMSRFTNMVAGQQYYQMPEDALRISKIKVNAGSVWYPCEEIGDEQAWWMFNQSNQQGAIPTHYFVKGFDEFGLFPTPSASVTNGIELIFEPKHVLLTADDYTTGSLTLTNGSQTVTGTSTVFAASMVGYYLQITDGTDGNYYRISAYSNATSITIENYYQGASGTVANGGWRIGQVSKIPEEFQEAPVDYAMYRHFLGKGELAAANEFKAIWQESLKVAKDTYGNSTGNQIINASRSLGMFNPLRDVTTNQIRTS
jgi:hypothetical protein